MVNVYCLIYKIYAVTLPVFQKQLSLLEIGNMVNLIIVFSVFTKKCKITWAI